MAREYVIGTVREFHTAQFRVVVDAIEDNDIDWSWDEDGSAEAKVNAGEHVAFCARVRVFHKVAGLLATEYLGGCVYASVAEFQDHQACGAQTRTLRESGSAAVCGSYFAYMIGEAIKVAREYLRSVRAVYVRELRA